MIILDTHLLSELLRAIPEPAVMRWTASQPLNTLFTTTVTQAEMLYGARLLSAGQRRRQLEEALAALFEEDFAGRVLPFDGDAALAYAGIAAERKRSGRPISQFDAQIAAIARSRGGYLATRNVGDFAACELQIINPSQPE